MRKYIVLLFLVTLVGFGLWYWHSTANPAMSYRTAVVERGDLLATINATGTVEPEEVVDVGAQVAGQVTTLGPDPRSSSRTIDYGSPVEKDTVLAQIDDAVYRSQVDQARAQVAQTEAGAASADALVEQAEANVRRAQADIGQMQAKVSQSEREWARAQRLGRDKGVIADTDYDIAEANYKTAKATLAVGDAAIAQAKAGLSDARAAVAKAKATGDDVRANLKRAEVNLGYCTIKSPVKGVIVDRRVNVGQTVVSSLNSPSLFLIAKDLKRLQVWASVNEADVGNIHSGQAVHFTVDAFAGQTFKGVVAPDQPRLNASMTQNVVTYTVVVNTDNSSGKLLPYLTANLQFEVDQHSNVLLVPSAALRWRPQTPAQVAPDAREKYQQALRRKGDGDKKPQAEPKEPHERGTLWVEDGAYVRPVAVHVGLSDGVHTEITGEINEGDHVVIGQTQTAAEGTSNPFTPQMFGGGKKQ